MSTGHCSTHAPHVVQDHSTSGCMTSGTRRLAAIPSSGMSFPLSSSEDDANSCSRRSMITSFGESGLSVFQAGHWSWQRPHSVQLMRSRRCFHVRSLIVPVPNTVSSVIFSGSRSGVVASGPRALGRREKSTLGSDTKMCMCLDCSTKRKKPQITASWARMNTVSR